MRRWFEQNVDSGDRSQIQLSLDTIDGRHIGGVQLKNISWIHRHAELGIFIGESSARNKGYGTEAIRLLAAYAFDVLHLHKLYLLVDHDNEPAIAVYRKIGFHETGRLPDEIFREGRYHDYLIMTLINDTDRCDG